MKEHEHHDEPSGVDKSAVLAQLDQRHQDARVRREHELQTYLQKVTTDAKEMLCRLNRGEPVEVTAEAAPGLTENRPYRDTPDDELDTDAVAGICEAKRRGLLPARFQQSREDFDAEVAAMKAEHWRALRSGDSTTTVVARRAGFACVTRRVPVRSRERRERRPGTRTATSGSRAGPGSDPDEPDPPGAAGSGDDDGDGERAETGAAGAMLAFGDVAR